jgi:hypothetical protein
MLLNRGLMPIAVLIAVIAGLPLLGRGDVPSPPALTHVEIPAVKDNTIYGPNSTGNSNGAGDYFFVGATNALELRRGLVAFHVADSIPAGSLISMVTLSLTMSKTISGVQAVNVHRVLADWGEGASNAALQEGTGAAAQTGDATWIYRFFNTLAWTTAGGDFVGTTSATQSVGSVGAYTWTGAGLVADVQAWVNDPSIDFGWALVDGEATLASAKRFNSRTNPTAASRPVLIVEYTPGNAIDPATFGEIKSLFR